MDSTSSSTSSQASQTAHSPTRDARVRMVTPRSLLTALALIPINAYWVTKMEVFRYLGHPTTISLFYNVVFILVVLLAVNAGLRKISTRLAYTPAELMTVYIMLAISSAVAGHDMIEVLTPILAHSAFYARPENGWTTEILPYVPKWLSVTDPDALKQFYEGAGSFYNPRNFNAWLGPVLWWSALLTVLGFMMLCMNTLLRRQWTESERLSYPLVALPLEMVSEKSQIFKTKLFWSGIAIAAGLELWNGFAFLYPSMPLLPLKRFGPMQDLSTYITAPPWNAIGGTPIALYPFGIALGMLLPVDLLFSVWFFAWFWRMERVFTARFGYGDIPGFPYVEAQSFGAYIGLAVFALYVSRSHFVRIGNNLLRFKHDLGDAKEPLPYRWAVLGILAGTGFVFWFSQRAGMSYMMIGAFFLIYFTLAIAITRMRAELGPPAHDLHMAGPDSIIPSVTTSNQISRGDLAMFSMYYGFNRAYRSHPMPIQLEAFKIAERCEARYRPLFWAMLLALAFGALAAFWAMLHQNYQVGAAEKVGPPNVNLIFGSEPWNRMTGWVRSPSPPQQQFNTRVAIGVGFLFTLAMNMLRLRLGWFPFHPVGFAVSGSWSLGLLWLPLMLAWLLKLVIHRYGGLRAYRQYLPLFLGVILGECVIGSVWTLVGIYLDMPTYAFWP